MSETPRLTLPQVAAAQAQKHVTHNEALAKLDALVDLYLLDRHLTAPPGGEADGDAYLVAAGATDGWAGQDGKVAYRLDGAWRFYKPFAGLRAFVADEQAILLHDGEVWRDFGSILALQNVPLLGLGTTADAANPFSAKLNKALWTAKTVAEGGDGDLFYAMNKEGGTDDVGVLLQSGFVTKTLLGLFGSNIFRLAMSSDGSAFNDSLQADTGTGLLTLPSNPKFAAYTNFDNYVAVGTWTKIAINNADYNDQGAFDAANNYFTAPAAGLYLFGAHLLYKVNASTNARMQARLVKNGAAVIPGSFGGMSGAHVSEVTFLGLQAMAMLAANDTVELQGSFTAQDGYFAADHTRFWGALVA